MIKIQYKCILLPSFLLLILIVFCITEECIAMGINLQPTVTVIDDETDKPIEGAVAIAIWRKTSSTEGAWFEGGKFEVTRIEEEISDGTGNIYINGFWKWHLFRLDPHLTIYKPGYICWDQESIYIDKFHRDLRTDFNTNNRIARMKKLPEEFSFIGHKSFINDSTFDDYYKAPRQLFNKTLDYEIPFRVKENDEINKKKRDVGKEGGKQNEKD